MLMVIFWVLKFIFVGQKCIMHHLSSSPAISAGGSWGTRALSSAESSALPIPVSLVDAGPPLAALRAFLRRRMYRIIPDAIRSTATAIPTPIPALAPVEIPVDESCVVSLPLLAPAGFELVALLPAVLAGLRLAGAAVVVTGLDVGFVDALLSKLRMAVSVASQATVTPMLRTIEILVYANVLRGV